MFLGELDHVRVGRRRDRGGEERRGESGVGGMVSVPEGRDLRGRMRGRIDEGEVQDLRQGL